ncbi:LOW QUALITY PROTEIN: uncharacterized protein [Drosophila suzukii]|uniref:LOW QUALITY PROTEIN: uncharacterized protein n=1 Tax=Drosophila suzukii TaxID=28584 RepID=A0ABM4TSK4_DROSZ
MNFIIFPSIRSNSRLELRWSVRKLQTGNRKRSNIRSSRTRRLGRMSNSWPEDELDTEAQEMQQQQQQQRPHKDNIAGGFTLIRLTIDKRGDLFSGSKS